MNAHLSDAAGTLSKQRLLEEKGYGVIQLPPADAPLAVIEIAIRFVVDQVQDYIKNSYEVVEVAAECDPDKASRLFRKACEARGIRLRSWSIES